jgi:hypothetical protein
VSVPPQSTGPFVDHDHDHVHDHVHDGGRGVWEAIDGLREGPASAAPRGIARPDVDVGPPARS